MKRGSAIDRNQGRTRTWPTTFATLLALFFSLFVLAAPADAFVYWVNYSDKSIGRANLDGTGVNERFITGIGPSQDVSGGPAAVAVDAQHIYWAAGQTIDRPGSIARARLDGTKVDGRFIPGSTGEIAVDGRHIYWTVNIGAAGGFYSASIARANLDGTGVEQGFITGFDGYVWDIAINGSHIYWDHAERSGLGSIGRANLDGTGVNDRLVTVRAPGSITLDGEHLYWADRDPASIGRANLDGTDIEQDFIGVEQALAITHDADHLYWGWQQGIGRAGLDGTDVRSRFIGLPSQSIAERDVAVDGLDDTTAPTTKITNGVPEITTRSELKLKFKSSEPNSSFECRLDKKPFKPCFSPEKPKHLDVGKHTFRVRAIDAALNVDPSPAKDKFKVTG